MATLPAIEPLRVPNPLEGYAQVEQILGARQQREANALAMKQRQQALEAEEQIRRYQAGGGDPRGLLQFGAAGAQAFERQIKGEQDFANLATSKFTMGRDLVLRADNPDALVNTVRSFFKDPVLGPTLTGLGQNVEGLTQYIVQNSSTPDGFDRVRLQLGQKAEDLGKSIQEMMSERQVAAALGVGAPGAPAAPTAAPAMPAAAAPTGAIATPVPEPSVGAPILTGPGAPALAPGGMTRLTPLNIPTNALAAREPVTPPVNAMVAQAAPGTGVAPLTALDPSAERRAQLQQLMRHPSEAVRKAAEAELRTLPAVPTLPEVVRLRQLANSLPAGDPNRRDIEARIRVLTTEPTAARVEVKLPPQEGAFQTALGTGQAKKVLEDKAVADDAVSIIGTVQQGRQLLQSGMITGFGAEFLTNVGAALNQIGINFAEDRVANTQAFAANMAQNVAKLIKQFGAGTGLSNDDRIYATKMAGGNVSLDRAAIEKILDINERAARNVINLHNERVKGIQSIIPLTVEMPAAQAPRAPAGTAAPRSGAAAPAPAPARAGGTRREIAPGVFVTERP